jgi:citrate lyase beta subunit
MLAPKILRATGYNGGLSIQPEQVQHVHRLTSF